MTLNTFLLVALLPFMLASVNADLEAVLAKAKLRIQSAYMATGYDGTDSIFLWSMSDSIREIWEYSISSDTIKLVGTMVNSSHGTVV